MSFALTFTVAVAITNGEILLSPLWSVGPYREATDPPGSVRFACLDLQGVPSRASETWSEAFEVGELPYALGGKVNHEPQFATDWSAFGAAARFVLLAGREAAEEALTKLEQGTRETLPMGEPAEALAG